ncbi:MAG TPA: hypothetical protein PLB62_16915, partial [Candidatus Sumerlaeota bacterium]|nr:hypothetical protein [Candidatus Sumerlaeota bacterium]
SFPNLPDLLEFPDLPGLASDLLNNASITHARPGDGPIFGRTFISHRIDTGHSSRARQKGRTAGQSTRSAGQASRFCPTGKVV